MNETETRAVLIKLIKMSKDFNGNFDEFITYLDDIKLGMKKKKNTRGGSKMDKKGEFFRNE